MTLVGNFNIKFSQFDLWRASCECAAATLRWKSELVSDAHPHGKNSCPKFYRNNSRFRGFVSDQKLIMISKSCNTNGCNIFPKRDGSAIDKSHFYLSTDGDCNEPTENDFEEFTRGVNILQELADNGIISGDEETRRKGFLKHYVDYNRGSEDLSLTFSQFRICNFLLVCFHRAREYCLGFAYYTDTDD